MDLGDGPVEGSQDDKGWSISHGKMLRDLGLFSLEKKRGAIMIVYKY